MARRTCAKPSWECDFIFDYSGVAVEAGLWLPCKMSLGFGHFWSGLSVLLPFVSLFRFDNVGTLFSVTFPLNSDLGTIFMNLLTSLCFSINLLFSFAASICIIVFRRIQRECDQVL